MKASLQIGCEQSPDRGGFSARETTVRPCPFRFYISLTSDLIRPVYTRRFNSKGERPRSLGLLVRQRDFPPPRSIDTAAENDRNGIDALPSLPLSRSSLADLLANVILPARKTVAFL